MTLEKQQWNIEQCNRCHQCKASPVQTSKKFAPLCPAIEYGQFHAYSASGKIITSYALMHGSAQYTPEALDSITTCSMCGDLKRQIREMGAVITPAMFADTAAIMAPDALRPDSNVLIERDLSYGPHERHRLDIFRPSNAATGSPVVVYVHGGGFVQGDKGSFGGPFYDNIGAWAVQAGAIGVTMNYRLAPQNPWPAGAEDIAAALDLLQVEVAARGGDPASIFLMGQSAGAAHVASFVAMPALRRGLPIAGAIMLSGLYDLATFPHGPMEAAYYGTDAAGFAAKSSLGGLLESPVPCLFSIAEYDPEKFQQQAVLLIARWFAERGVLPAHPVPVRSQSYVARARHRQAKRSACPRTPGIHSKASRAPRHVPRRRLRFIV